MRFLSALVILLALTGCAAPPPITKQAEAPEGPRCTPAFPRGFKLTPSIKKSPSCKGGELQYTWRICTPRHNV